MRTLGIIGGLMLTGALALRASGALLAFDHAGEAAYADGWQSGDNGGSGFGPWALSSGLFQISTSTTNGFSPPPATDIDSPGGRAWNVRKLQTINPPDAIATRSLNGTLDVGQTIAVDIDTRSGLNTEAGFSLRNTAGQNRLRIYDVAVIINVTDATSGNHPIGLPGDAEHGMHLAITLTGPDTYMLAYNSFGGPVSILSGTLAGTPGSGIDTIALDQSVFPITGAANFPYFNNLAVVPEPGAVVLVLPLVALCTRRRLKD